MPMPTASDVLMGRMEQDKSMLQSQFEQQWALVNRQYGLPSKNPKIEAARRKALLSLHQKFSVQANKLKQDYAVKFHGFSEVDTMANNGMMTADPEEIKLKMALPKEIEKAVFPEEEEAPDPIKEYGALHTQRERVRSSLKRFETVAPRPKGTFSDTRWYKFRGEYRDPGGVGKYVEVNELSGYDKKDEPIFKRRAATQQELREWANLTEHERKLSKAMTDIIKSDPMASRLRSVAMKSKRMLNAGTFADKAVGNLLPVKEKETQTIDFGSMSDEELKRLAGIE